MSTLTYTLIVCFFSAVLLICKCSNGLLLSSSDTWEDTPFHRACRNGLIDDIKKIIESISSQEYLQTLLEEKGIGGHTPLLASVVAEEDAIVMYLLEKGANITTTDKDGYNAMHNAAFFGRTKIIKILSKKGLNVSDYHHDGYAPIHRAAWGLERKHTDVVGAILKITKGDAVGLRTISGKTSFDITRNRQTIRLLKQWQKKSDKKFTIQYWVFIMPLVLLLIAWFFSSQMKGRMNEFKPTNGRERITPALSASATEARRIATMTSRLKEE